MNQNNKTNEAIHTTCSPAALPSSLSATGLRWVWKRATNTHSSSKRLCGYSGVPLSPLFLPKPQGAPTHSSTMSTNRTYLKMHVQRWLAFLAAYKNNPGTSQGRCSQRERRLPLSPATVCDGARSQRPLSLVSVRRGTRGSHPFLRLLSWRTLRYVCWLGWAGAFEPKYRLGRATGLPPSPHGLGDGRLHVAPRGFSRLLPAHTCAGELSRCFRVCSARCTLVNFNWWYRPLGKNVESSEPAPLIVQDDYAPNFDSVVAPISSTSALRTKPCWKVSLLLSSP